MTFRYYKNGQVDASKFIMTFIDASFMIPWLQLLPFLEHV